MFSEDNGKTWYSVKDKTEDLKELSYSGAMWFQEIFQFYKLATEEEIRNFEKLVKADNESRALKLVKKVLGL